MRLKPTVSPCHAPRAQGLRLRPTRNGATHAENGCGRSQSNQDRGTMTTETAQGRHGGNVGALGALQRPPARTPLRGNNLIYSRKAAKAAKNPPLASFASRFIENKGGPNEPARLGVVGGADLGGAGSAGLGGAARLRSVVNDPRLRSLAWELLGPALICWGCSSSFWGDGESPGAGTLDHFAVMLRKQNFARAKFQRRGNLARDGYPVRQQ